MKITNNPNTQFITIRTTEEKKEEIKKAAKQKRLSVGKFLIQLADREIQEWKNK